MWNDILPFNLYPIAFRIVIVKSKEGNEAEAYWTGYTWKFKNKETFHVVAWKYTEKNIVINPMQHGK